MIHQSYTFIYRRIIRGYIYVYPGIPYSCSPCTCIIGTGGTVLKVELLNVTSYASDCPGGLIVIVDASGVRCEYITRNQIVLLQCRKYTQYVRTQYQLYILVVTQRLCCCVQNCNYSKTFILL